MINQMLRIVCVCEEILIMADLYMRVNLVWKLVIITY